MLSKIRYHIVLLLCLFCSAIVFAVPKEMRSTNPFTASISVSGNSVYLSDYADAFYPPVSITIVCNDPTIANIQVKLAIGIKVAGFSAESKTYNTLPPINLGAGDVYMLSGDEVSKLYSKENLHYSGLSSNRMPEGLAEFTVKVLEYNTGVQLSNTAYTLKNLKQLSPTRLLSPLNKSEIKIEQASSVLFTWSSVFVPISSSVEYEFTLKEVQDESVNISSAFNYSPIIYKETTNLTSLIYSVDKPLLEEGKTYAWAVKTIVRDAKGLVQDIVNNGFSEVYSFKVPRPVVQTPQSNKVPEKDDDDDSHCGEIPVVDLSNQTPIETLNVGDTITAGDFPILLLEVSGANGNFSGKGSVEIPYISKLARFAVEFENIGVNTDKQLISGEIKGVRSGNLDNIANLDAIDYGSTRECEKVVISSDISLKVPLPKEPLPTVEYNFESKILTFYNATGEVIASAELNNPAGEKVFPITVEDENGELYQISETKNQDGEKEVAITHIGKKGRKIPSDAFSTEHIDEHIAIVEFEALDSPYSFDTYMEYYKNIPLINQINTLEPDLRYPELAKDYHTPWQFIPIGEKVNLKAKLKIKDKKTDFEPKDIVFATEEGVIMPSTFNEKDNTYTFSAPAAAEEGYYFIHALYERGDNDYLHFGKIGIDTRKPISAKVVLVPMGGSYDLSSLSSGINAISKQVGVSWQVEEYTDFEYSSELSASLFEKNSGVLFSYNDAQSVLNSALKAHLGSKFDPSACYVFMFDKAPFKNDRNIIGFMPRGGKFGYIHCQGLSSESLAQILTHELMHGQFLLRHTFDDKYANGLKQGVNPTNLMDYKGGTHLAKWQWDQIYDPAITTSLIKYDEEGEFYADIDLKIYSLKEEINDGDFVFISSKPEMPQIYVKPDVFLTIKQPDSITKTQPLLSWQKNVLIRAKIKYERYNKENKLIRNDSLMIPSTDWDSIKVGDTWHLDFKNQFCGGTAIIECIIDNTYKSKKFYIRGENPSKQEILNYLEQMGYNEWYLPKMIMHESKMNQFNSGTDFKPDGFVGCPNWGYPNGYGLMQLDNFGENKDGTKIYATIHELWNWKSNIDRGVKFLREDKANWARAKMRGYLAKARDDIGELDVPIIYYVANGINEGKHLKTLKEGGNNVYEIFSIYPQENERDMADAITIKYYNGGLYCEFQKGGVNTESKWLIYPYNPVNNVYYVKEVCSEIY